MYYDREGNSITLWEWCRRVEDMEYKVVAIAEIQDARVSTVWLGLDHNFSGQGPPLIFETMIFGGEMDEYMWRWSTEAEALAGHHVVVMTLMANLKDEQ
jgi:hypothetical protein